MTYKTIEKSDAAKIHSTLYYCTKDGRALHVFLRWEWRGKAVARMGQAGRQQLHQILQTFWWSHQLTAGSRARKAVNGEVKRAHNGQHVKHKREG